MLLKTSSHILIRFSNLSQFDLMQKLFCLQPTCFQLRSQSFTSPRNLKEFSRRRGVQEQSQSFTCHNEGEERRRVQLGQSYDLSSQVSRSKEGLPARRRLQELEARDGRGEEGKGWERLQSIRRRLQEKRRKQEKENVEEATAMQDRVGKGGSGWNLDKVRRAESGIEVKGVDFEEDFDMRQGGRDFDMRQGGRDFEMRKGKKDFEMRQGEKDFEMREGGRDFEMRQGGRDFEMREGGRDRRQLMRSTSLTAPLSLRPAFARSLSQSSLLR